MKMFMKLLSIFLLINLVSCGALTRKKMFNQKITIRDSRNDALLEGVVVKIDGKEIGKTNGDGVVKFIVNEVDDEANYVISLEKNGFQPITVTVYNQAGGNYIAGGIAFFLLGLAPGVISLAVDGATGTWYTYKQKLDIKMNAL